MYKVFNSNALIFLNSDDVKISTYNYQQLIKLDNKVDFFKRLDDYFTGRIISDVLFFGYDKAQIFNDFCSYFKYIEAAGGIVKNSKEEILFIKRLGFWDFPKGKIEKGETSINAAIREVEEETGVKGLQIIADLSPTYHIYQHNNKRILKKTFWYKMITDHGGQLTPQSNEGIELAEWHSKNEVADLLDKSYRSLRENFIEVSNY